MKKIYLTGALFVSALAIAACNNNAADNKAENISCGGGTDIVFFDQGDDTLSVCEDKRAQ